METTATIPDRSATTSQTPLPRAWSAVSSRLRVRAGDRSARRALESELASYRSEADRLELDAMLSRYDDSEVADIRRIADRVAAA